MDRLGTALEIKTVDHGKRLITGFAAFHANTDRVDDIIEPGASVKAIQALSAPSDVAVFVGHQTSALPVGIPIKLEATPQGLLTETLVKPGPVGDDLLATAKFLAEHGQALGMSIGYQIPPGGAKLDRVGNKTIRRITDYRLREYSFAARQMIANPEALVVGVKAAGGGQMMRIEERDGKWHVLDADGNDMGSFDSEAAARTAMSMMKALDDQGQTKATWSAAYVNDLPDSSFLYVEPGGQKDEGGRTVPRSLRHFPYKDDSGAVDLPHVRNAIARIPQSQLPADLKTRLQARARTILENASSGKMADPSTDWEDGTPLALKGIAYRLLDLADELAAEHTAMALLGEDTKDGQRMRPEMRQRTRELGAQITNLVSWAETIDAGRDAEARLASLRHELELLSV